MKLYKYQSNPRPLQYILHTSDLTSFDLGSTYFGSSYLYRKLTGQPVF